MRNLGRKFPLERKKHEQIKGLISNMCLLFCYTIQLITIKLCIKFQNPKSSNTIKPCTKFQNPKSSSCLEILDRKKFTDKQTSKKKHNYRKCKNYISQYILYPGYKYCILMPGPYGKGDGVFVVTKFVQHFRILSLASLSSFVPNFRILSQVVA